MKLLTKEDLISAFEEYNEILYRFVYVRVAGSKEAAEDLTQDVFLKAWEKRNSFNPQKASLKTWLFVIARNKVIDYYRTRKTFVEIEDDQTVGETKDFEVEDTYKYLLKAIKKLSTIDQEIIALRFIQQFEIDEIAVTIDRTREATKVAIHRAIKKLRKIINAEN